MSRRPVVYLIAQPTVKRDGRAPNLVPLGEWGDVRVLIQPGESPANNPQKAFELMRQRFEHFDPRMDFIAWAGGDTLTAVLLGVILGDISQDPDYGFETVNWLRYDRPRTPEGGRTDEGARYVPIRVPLFGLLSGIEAGSDPSYSFEEDDL